MSTMVHPSTNAVPAPTRLKWLALMVLVLPTVLVAANGTILSFALPTLSTALDPTATKLLWIVDVYPLVLAGLLVVMGVLGDRFGRRRLLVLGTAGFAVVSVACALTDTPSALIAARALLGVFGAMLLPPTIALLKSIFSDAGERRLAVAVWATGFSAGGALGPIIGGFLLEHFWWGSVFLVAVPVAGVLLLAAPRLLPESQDPAPGPLDMVSVALAMTGMAPLVYAVKTLFVHGASLTGALALGVGTVSVALFVRRQGRLANPLLDLGLFRIPLFGVSVLANLLAISAFTGLLFFSSQYLQLVVGLSPLAAALHVVPSALASVTTGLLAVRLARRFSVRVLIPLGLVVSALGYLVATTLSAGPSAALLVVAMVLVSGGVGLAETLTNDSILSAAPSDRAGAASAISETAYELGAVLGTSVLGSVLSMVYRSQLAVPAGVPRAAGERAGETLGGALEVAGTLPVLGPELRHAAQEAFTAAVDVTAALGAVLVLAAAFLVAIKLRPSSPR